MVSRSIRSSIVRTWVCTLGAVALSGPIAAFPGVPDWSQTLPAFNVPGPRSGHAAAFDPSTGKTMLFGGLGFQPLQDTWVWSPSLDAWFLIEGTAAPAPRYDHQIVFDVSRDQFVLFGGWDGTTALGDTWIWDPNTEEWTVSSGPAPPARHGHVMVYDTSRDLVIVHGGFDGVGAPLEDQWEWNGTTWTQKILTVPHPDPRGDHAGFWDDSRARLVVFGGESSAIVFGDTWEYDPAANSWVDRAPVAPPPPLHHHRMSDAPGDLGLLFGGFSGATLSASAWTWDGLTGVWLAETTNVTDPAARASHVLVRDPTRGVTLMIAGETVAGNVSDVWEWTSGWAAVTPQPPQPQQRAEHSVAYHQQRDRVYVFGGFDSGSRNDLWQWQPSTGSWVERTQRTGGPVARRQGMMVYDEIQQTLVLFGGVESGGTSLADTWLWDGGWIDAAPAIAPPAVAQAAMAYDPVRREVVLFGGTNGVNELATTWVWNGALRSWTNVSPASSPPVRSGAQLAYSDAQDRMYLFGGRGAGGALADTWSWRGDNRTWAQRSPSTPPPARWGHAMVYDPAQQAVVLFGGEDGTTALGDTWQYDGTDWELSTPATRPSNRSEASMAYVDREDMTLLFGGQTAVQAERDAWSYVVNRTPDHVRIDTDGAGTACVPEVVNLVITDAAGTAIIDPTLASVDITVTVTAPTGSPRIILAALNNVTGVGTSSVSGQTPPTGAATLFVTLDASDTLTITATGLTLPGSLPETITFTPGAVSDVASSFTADPVAFLAGESTMLTLSPRATCGGDLGPGETVTMTATSGTLGPVFDRGDGTYTASYTHLGCPTIAPVVTARIGAAVAGSLSLQPFCAVLDPNNSSVTVLTDTAEACGLESDSWATVEVIPYDTAGNPMPPGRVIALAVTSPAQLFRLGEITTTVNADGATVYRVEVGSDRCTPNGPRQLGLTVNDVPLATVPKISFTCPPVDADSIIITAGPAAIADGNEAVIVRVEAVDTCGEFAFDRPVTLTGLEPDSPVLFPPTQTSVSARDTPDDGNATFYLRSKVGGVFGVRVDFDGATKEKAELLTFISNAFPYAAEVPAAAAGQVVTFRATLTNDGPSSYDMITVTSTEDGLRVLSVSVGDKDLDGPPWALGTLLPDESIELWVHTIARPGAKVASSQLTAKYWVSSSPAQAVSIKAQVVVSDGSTHGCECGQNGSPGVWTALFFTALVLRRRR